MSDITFDDLNKDIEDAYEQGKETAEKLLKDPDKMEMFLQRAEQVIQSVPFIGEKLSMLPVMISFLKSYIKNEYREAPVTVPVSIVAALLYLISPKDIIPDKIPVLGIADDIAVIYFAWKYVKDDLELYQDWRKENGLEVIFTEEEAQPAE
ncbi:MAG: DUF1232 domain-containing protein [Clostridia bacterium]|nr:DUF1232 domain-containing protein [Clostridia bacterium]